MVANYLLDGMILQEEIRTYYKGLYSGIYVLRIRDFPEPILWPGDGMFRPSILRIFGKGLDS